MSDVALFKDVIVVGPTTQLGVLLQPEDRVTIEGRPVVLTASATFRGALTSSQCDTIDTLGTGGDVADSPLITGIANVPPNGVSSKKVVDDSALRVQSSASQVVVLERDHHYVSNSHDP